MLGAGQGDADLALEVAAEEQHMKVLAGLQETLNKFRTFAMQIAKAVSASPEEVEMLLTGLNQDVTVFVLAGKDFFFGKDAEAARQHNAMVDKKDIRALHGLMPAVFQKYEIPESFHEKGFLFAEVFRDLLRLIK